MKGTAEEIRTLAYEELGVSPYIAVVGQDPGDGQVTVYAPRATTRQAEALRIRLKVELPIGTEGFVRTTVCPRMCRASLTRTGSDIDGLGHAGCHLCGTRLPTFDRRLPMHARRAR